MRLLALLLLASCNNAIGPFYTCTSSSQCMQESVQGQCEATNYCSFPDANCVSGRRYSAFSATGLRDRCVGTDDAGITIAPDVDLASGDFSVVDQAPAVDFLLPDLSIPSTTLVASLPHFDFGPMDSGAATPKMTLIFTNTGPAATATLQLQTSGDTSGFPLGTDGCSGSSLAVGAFCSVTFRFAPTRLGAHSATARISDGNNSSESALSGTGTAPINYAFVTLGTHNGNFGGLTGADATCAAAALQAGLPTGTYVALLSSSTTDAVNRIRAARGFKRTDGRIFGDTAVGLFSGASRFYPLVLDEDAQAVSALVWTATATTGASLQYVNPPCGDWLNTIITNAVYMGDPTASGNAWINLGSGRAEGCVNKFALYCFQVDHVTPISLPSPDGRVIFVSSTPFVPGGGLTAADALCRADAATAGLQGNFKALLSTSAGSAASRFTIRRAPIWRSDGALFVASDVDVLAAYAPLTGLTITGVGDYTADQAVWTGAASGFTTTASTCMDWTSTSAVGNYGNSAFTATVGGANTSTTCTNPSLRIYCMSE